MSRARVSALFTWRSAIADTDLRATVKLVAFTLSLYMSELGDSAFPSLKTLAARASLSKSTVVAALKVLEELGWLRRSAGGGRGNRTFYEATTPETVHAPDSFSMISGAHEGPVAAPGEASKAAPWEGHDGGRTRAQRVRPVDSLPERKVSEPRAETVRGTARNCPGAVPEYVINTPETAAASAAAAGDEGIELDRALSEIGVGAALRLEALQDIPRARAWFDLAKAEADTNPAGYFRNCFRSGEWPSKRAGNQGPTGRAAWIENYSWQFPPDDAHAIVDGWTDVDDVERSRLHEEVERIRERHATADVGEVAAS